MTSATSITVRVPLAIRHRPGRKTVVTPAAPGPAAVTTRANPTLVKALARAFRYQRMLDDKRCQIAFNIFQATASKTFQFTRSFSFVFSSA